ncbi:beta-phosphoglucomutase [Geminocystis sp. NIES-3708]|uniref:HAD family hydrolase n=1 Tax=Geminocystis sp. NIES-3708 TaxID=1615909 RepID=UPI0005FCC1D0|nr:HAD family phosphatase [Geminocystis sp. NIES-3708]BAQ61951.1 beta-phosphoglucomutase [Geminocystis sp. NIES-3708]
MSLKAIIFDLNGVIINDEPIHQQLIDDLLLGENLLPSGKEYQKICLGKNDQSCVRDILAKRGRIIDDDYLSILMNKKAEAYHKIVNEMSELPIYDKVVEFILSLQPRHLSLAIVTGLLYREVEYILKRMNIREYFNVIIAGEDIKLGKPSPSYYLRAVKQLNQQNPDLSIKTSECLVIEDTPIGIESAKNAGISVVGVANTYPFHLLQRQANWCVDHLMQLDLNWIDEILVKT